MWNRKRHPNPETRARRNRAKTDLKPSPMNPIAPSPFVDWPSDARARTCSSSSACPPSCRKTTVSSATRPGARLRRWRSGCGAQLLIEKLEEPSPAHPGCSHVLQDDPHGHVLAHWDDHRPARLYLGQCQMRADLMLPGPAVPFKGTDQPARPNGPQRPGQAAASSGMAPSDRWCWQRSTGSRPRPRSRSPSGLRPGFRCRSK